MSKYSKYVPDRKVLAGGIAGVAAFVVVVVAGVFGVEISPEAAAAAIAAVGSVVAYLVPSPVGEVLDKADAIIKDIGREPEAAGDE
jgi:uncharacterized membrane protein YjjB (DUF3815 family)